ncbi:hypothetical protein FGG08_002366 [Glutinoglossum americanum]|uniref:Uncharacterized protein n=1 Tax=Glutinoglossum americanum TaxID=1670608 RepID=A0A9P8I9C8_9PEZI|nr:hypothetical protein FGG08_002366 [Glutinoglossum americanum]
MASRETDPPPDDIDQEVDELPVNKVIWKFVSRNEPLEDPGNWKKDPPPSGKGIGKPPMPGNSPTPDLQPGTALPGVVFRRVDFGNHYRDNGLAALVESLNLARVTSGGPRITVNYVLEVAYTGERDRDLLVDQVELSEQQMVYCLEKTGPYRLAIIEPSLSRVRLADGTQKEGTIVYVLKTEDSRWAAVELRTIGPPGPRGFYPEFTRVHSSPSPPRDNFTEPIEIGNHTADRERRDRRLRKLRDEICIRMYEMDRRNQAEGQVFGLRTWAGQSRAEREGGDPPTLHPVQMGEGQRAVSSKARPGTRPKARKPTAPVRRARSRRR